MSNVFKLIAWEVEETRYPRKFLIKHVYGSPSYWNPMSFLMGKPFLIPIHDTEIVQFPKKV